VPRAHGLAVQALWEQLAKASPVRGRLQLVGLHVEGGPALSENWEKAYAHAKKAHQGKTSFDLLEGFYLHYEVEALLQGGDERGAREEIQRFAERAWIGSLGGPRGQVLRPPWSHPPTGAGNFSASSYPSKMVEIFQGLAFG
jgi:hypothetical protein